MTPVYSIPNYSVYVMVPDESSISEAKTQINSVMGEIEGKRYWIKTGGRKRITYFLSTGL